MKDDKNGDIRWLDFKAQVECWETVPEEVLISTHDKESLCVAKLKEIHNWKDNDVFVEVPYEDQLLISTRWVISVKMQNGVPVTKARLVARGFEDMDISVQNTNSPTCTKESLRVALTVMAMNNWKCKSMDVNTAFLQGNPLTRKIFLKPPKEA